ncbi:MAG: hypothetical protein PHN78_04385 [Dehalococcoidales bacterium]|nr:hypothetical protein [Dehalococcoidales bacterium]
MRKLKVIISMLLLFAFIPGLIGCGGGTTTPTTPTTPGGTTGPAPEEGVPEALWGLAPLKIRAADCYANKSLIDVTIRIFMRLVENESGGKIKFVYFGSSALGSATDLGRMLPQGAIDFAHPWGITQVSTKPKRGNMAPSWTLDWWGGYEYSTPYGDVHEMFREENKAVNVFSIFRMSGGGQAEGGSLKINTASDLKGARIQASSSSSSITIIPMGGVPIFISFEEAYMGFYKDMIDWCTSCSQPSWVDRAWYEVAPYLSDRSSAIATQHSFTLFSNLDFWNKIPKPYQDLILDCGYRTQIWNFMEGGLDWELTRYKLVKYYGCEICEIAAGEDSKAQIEAITENRKVYFKESLKYEQSDIDNWFKYIADLNEASATPAYRAKWGALDAEIKKRTQEKIAEAEALIAGGMPFYQAFDTVGYRRLWDGKYEDMKAEIDTLLPIFPGPDSQRFPGYLPDVK